MGAASFTGLLFLGCGPLATVFVLCLASKSFLVLLALGRYGACGGQAKLRQPACLLPADVPLASLPCPSALLPSPCRSAFYWLCTLLLISALFRGEGPPLQDVRQFLCTSCSAPLQAAPTDHPLALPASLCSLGAAGAVSGTLCGPAAGGGAYTGAGARGHLAIPLVRRGGAVLLRAGRETNGAGNPACRCALQAQPPGANAGPLHPCPAGCRAGC